LNFLRRVGDYAGHVFHCLRSVAKELNKTFPKTAAQFSDDLRCESGNKGPAHDLLRECVRVLTDDLLDIDAAKGELAVHTYAERNRAFHAGSWNPKLEASHAETLMEADRKELQRLLPNDQNSERMWVSILDFCKNSADWQGPLEQLRSLGRLKNGMLGLHNVSKEVRKTAFERGFFLGQLKPLFREQEDRLKPNTPYR
jgi:hypothetical protein